jgi:hypothetical protein
MAKKQDKHGNLIDRLITVMFADPHHTLQLVEIKTKVRMIMGDAGIGVRVDRNEAERSARERLTLTGKDESKYDFVGILASAEDKLSPGRIVWAEEVETVEAVAL